MMSSVQFILRKQPDDESAFALRVRSGQKESYVKEVK